MPRGIGGQTQAERFPGMRLARFTELPSESSAVNPTDTDTSLSPRLHDTLAQYVEFTSGLSDKLGRIAANQQEVANSLGRAAAALRSISAARKRE